MWRNTAWPSGVAAAAAEADFAFELLAQQLLPLPFLSVGERALDLLLRGGTGFFQLLAAFLSIALAAPLKEGREILVSLVQNRLDPLLLRIGQRQRLNHLFVTERPGA